MVQTLDTLICKKAAASGFAVDGFRCIADAACRGLAAIHAYGGVHGALEPSKVMVDEGGATILDTGSASTGGARHEDDVRALALTLWAMLTCRTPEPGDRPRGRKMRTQLPFGVPAGLSEDELLQIYKALNDDPTMRPLARDMCFSDPAKLRQDPFELPRDRLHAGPPLGRAQRQNFTPDAQSLLITYAPGAPELVGTLLPLTKPEMTLGSRSDQDLVLPEVTITGAHAVFRWQNASWLVEDLGSESGIYNDYDYERRQQVSLGMGRSEVQLGECRIKLVSFTFESIRHAFGRKWLKRRDGLTGLLVRGHLEKALAEEQGFGDWAEVPVQVARYELNRKVSERASILEMLALRKAAQRAIEITEMRFSRLTESVAGVTGPLEFVVSMVGLSPGDAHGVLEQIASEVAPLLPDTLELSATLID